MTVASKPIDIQERLEKFLIRACPSINEKIQVEIAQEMKRSFSEWALAEEGDRGHVLERAQKRMIQILGISQEIVMEVEFSKPRIQGEDEAIRQTQSLTTVIENTISERRKKLSMPPLQLTLQITNVELSDPKFVQLACRLSGTELRVAELNNVKGSTNWKKFGRPSLLRFSPAS